MGSKTPTTDRASYSGGQGRGGANEKKHQERQKKLQTNINKLKAKGATKEAIAGLTAKKTKEAKKFELKTTGVEEGRRYVQSRIDAQRYGAGKAYGEGKISEKRLKETEMFGEEASKYTNEYLEKSGVAKGSALWKELKYGISDSAMGSGDPTGIMTSVPISEAMFEKQKKIQTLALAGMSLAMPMGLAQGMRAVAADTFQRPYSDYISAFYKGQSGETNFAKAKEFANQSKETANLAMGTTVSDGGEKKSTKFTKKTTKKTTKYFAGSYADEAKKKRKFFQHGAN